MTFEEFIEKVEDGTIHVNGLKHCSLEHRSALRCVWLYATEARHEAKRLEGKLV